MVLFPPAIARVGAVVWLVVLAAAPAAADWRRIDTPNFIVVGDIGPGTLRDVAVKFENFREGLSRVLSDTATTTAVPTVVIVFPSDKAFTPFKPLYQGKPLPVAGIFSPGSGANYVLMVSGPEEAAQRVIFHEYAHLVIANTMPNVPVWLNEGLAEFYSTFNVLSGGREATIGRSIPEHLVLLNTTTHLSTDELLNVDRNSPLYNEGERRSVFYAQSWALTHLILAGQPSRARELSTFLQNLVQGVPETQAWSQAFGIHPPDEELPRYLQRRTFSYYRFTFPEKLASFSATARPIPQPDVEAFLADVLVQQQRYDEAAVRLAAALRADPANARAAVAMARLESVRGFESSAEKRLLDAPGTDDWFVTYYSGILLADLVARQGDATDAALQAARDRLGAVNREHPDIPNVLARLAMLELTSDAVPSADALQSIERARTLAPGRPEYPYVHAQVLTRRAQFAEARAVLGRLMSTAYPPTIRDSARRLMGLIVDLETNSRSPRIAPPGPLASLPPTSPTGGDKEPHRAAYPQGRSKPEFRQLQPGEQRLEGTLERVECLADGAAAFHVRTPEGPRRLQARISEVVFIAYRGDLTGEVNCGALKEPMPVYVTERAQTSPNAAAVVVAIEFLPKEP
jgi:hypothetical protein